MHHRHALDDAQGHIHVMLDDDVADMARQRVENADEITPLGRGETGGGLIEQDETWRTGQGERDFQLALLAIGELANQPSFSAVRCTASTRVSAAWTSASSRRGRISEKRFRETPRQAR